MAVSVRDTSSEFDESVTLPESSFLAYGNGMGFLAMLIGLGWTVDCQLRYRVYSRDRDR